MTYRRSRIHLRARHRGIPALRTEAWLVSYGLLGLTQNGLVPVLMPLVAPHGGAAGLTYAAFSLLGLFAPGLGSWADHTGRHRDLLIWGSLGAGALLLLFYSANAPLRIVIAAGAGLGVMATTTAGNVLAIQGFSEAEWDMRVALLQRYISAGQVIGLVAAGVFARSHPGDGFVFAGVALLVAGALAFVSAPGRVRRDPDEKPAPRPMVGGDAGVSGPHHRGHHVTWQELRAVPQRDQSPAAAVSADLADCLSCDEWFRYAVPGGNDARVRHGSDHAVESPMRPVLRRACCSMRVSAQ